MIDDSSRSCAETKSGLNRSLLLAPQMSIRFERSPALSKSTSRPLQPNIDQPPRCLPRKML